MTKKFWILIGIIGVLIAFSRLAKPYQEHSDSVKYIIGDRKEESKSPPAAYDYQDSVRKTEILVDQDYSSMGSVRGFDWLKAIGTKKLSGDLSYATLTITNSGDSAVGMYYAGLTPTGGLDTSNEWRTTRFIDGEWVGDCSRKLYDYNRFNDGGSVDLSALPLSNADTCIHGVETIDLLKKMNEDKGAFLGFVLVNKADHLRVVLEYEGDLKVETL